MSGSRHASKPRRTTPRHRETDASKIALADLVARLVEARAGLLEVQHQTPHLQSLGAIEIARALYLGLLAELRDDDVRLLALRVGERREVDAEGVDGQARRHVGGEGGHGGGVACREHLDVREPAPHRRLEAPPAAGLRPAQRAERPPRHVGHPRLELGEGDGGVGRVGIGAHRVVIDLDEVEGLGREEPVEQPLPELEPEPVAEAVAPPVVAEPVVVEPVVEPEPVVAPEPVAERRPEPEVRRRSAASELTALASQPAPAPVAEPVVPAVAPVF